MHLSLMQKLKRAAGDYSLRKYLFFAVNPCNWPVIARLRTQKKIEIEVFMSTWAKFQQEVDPVGNVRSFVFRNWVVKNPVSQHVDSVFASLLDQEDPELRMRADRLSWALELAVGDRDFAWSEVESWLSSRAQAKDFYRDSYSASERISNLIMLWNISPPSDSLARAVEDMIIHDVDCLMQNPEYHGELNTNNHILNNARALILAGSFFNSQCWLDAGSWLLKEQFDKHINPDGLLREASSHYQLVVTRWVVEIACAFFYRDSNQFDQIQPRLKRMLDASDAIAHSWRDHWYIPLIGDASPDFPPGFYRGLTSFGRKLIRMSPSQSE